MAAAAETKWAKSTVKNWHRQREKEKQDHYNRNEGRNFPPKTIDEARKNNWKKAGDFENSYHRNNGANNEKWLSPDGRQEGVYNSDTGELDNSPENKGTYNFSPPCEAWNHFWDDVHPYWRWGNSPDDDTPFWKRVSGDFFEKLFETLWNLL